MHSPRLERDRKENVASGSGDARSAILGALLKRFARDPNANVAVIFAFMLPMLLGALGLGVDGAGWSLQRRELQAAADAAAIGAAKQLYLANMSDYGLNEVVEAMVSANLSHSLAKTKPIVDVQAGSSNSDSSGSSGTDSTKVASTDTDSFLASALSSYDGSTALSSAGGDTLTSPAAAGSVAVSLTQKRISWLSGAFFGDPGSMRVMAVAQILPGGRLCMIGLEESNQNAIYLKNSARVTATNCSVYSNSTNSRGLNVTNSGSITAEMICSAGGANGSLSSYEPDALEDCPPVPDPLVDREPPPVSSCTDTDLVLREENTTLYPGTYCGGLVITDGSQVVLTPGIYVICDGPFEVSAYASIKGGNVGLYMTGTNATINFRPNSSISLTAPKDGPMAGLLLFEDRNSSYVKLHRISSNDARMLLGTIYLPNGHLAVDANRPVADQSAYTAIVVRHMTLSEGPNLVLNANYGATDIPVPRGMGAVGGNIVLAR